MKTSAPGETIDVQALRVGMFVHLDGGWMSHPFPLSSFRIATPAQVATIRSLGLQQVRWSPTHSDAATLDGGAAAPQAAAGPLDGAAATDPSASGEEEGDTVPGGLGMPPSLSDARARAERRRKVAAECQAQKVCERQYGEAARECRHALELVASQPREAREGTEALSRALVDKMLGEQELCIRLLTEGAADRASMHAMNVGIISLLMGRCFGFAADEMLDLGVGALLHDVGKLDMPARLRYCEESFLPGEIRHYEEHVELGLVAARRMGLSAGATSVIAQHHELADGSGFPERLNADRMTMAARIVSLVNRYDNLCNPRIAARALTPHESLSLMFAQGRSQFDTSILGAFIKMMGVYPPGSTVQLTDDRYGIVVAVNSSRPLKPNVLVHDAAVPREEALVLDLELSPGLGIRRSIRHAQLPPTALDYLAPSARVAYFFEPSAPLD